MMGSALEFIVKWATEEKYSFYQLEKVTIFNTETFLRRGVHNTDET